MKYRLYQDRKKQWRWTLFAGNHRKIANSGEGYRNRADCLKAIRLVKGSAGAPVIGSPARASIK